MIVFQIGTIGNMSANWCELTLYKLNSCPKWSFQALNKLLQSPVDYSQCIGQAWAKVGGVSTDWLPLPMAPLMIFMSLVLAHEERSTNSTCPNPTKLMALACNDWAVPTRRGCRHLQ